MSDAHKPDEARQQLLEEFVARGRLLSRRDQLDAAAAEAVEALAAAGIGSLVLKGPALAVALYGPGEERGYFDIDLLVEPSKRVAARGVLEGLGYVDFSSRRGVDDIGGVLHADAWVRVVYGFGNIMIDLHWRLDGCEAPADDVWKVLCASNDPMEIAGHVVPTLGLAAMALHVALHVAQHGPGDVKAVGDLRRALQRWPLELWRDAGVLAQRVGGQDAFAAGLRLLPDGNRLADQLSLDSGERVLWEIANRRERPRGTFHLDALSQARTFTERAYVLRRALIPARAWITWEMRWASRGKAHLAAAYALHLLRAPLWALRALRFRRRRRN